MKKNTLEQYKWFVLQRRRRDEPIPPTDEVWFSNGAEDKCYANDSEDYAYI